MDLGQLPLFSMLARRMTWLGKRQEVLGQNVANVDTPGYRPQDLKDDRFRRLLRDAARSVPVVRTHEGHMANGFGIAMPASSGDGSHGFDPDLQPVTMPNEETVDASGNQVSLEDQLVKVSETAAQYQMVTALYRKHLNLIRIAIGRGN